MGTMSVKEISPHYSKYIIPVIVESRWFALTLDDKVGSQDGSGADAHASLSGSIGGTEASKDDSRCATQRTEEGLLAAEESVSFSKTSSESIGEAAVKGRRFRKR